MARLRVLPFLSGLFFLCASICSGQQQTVTPEQFNPYGGASLLSDATVQVTGLPFESVEDIVLNTTPPGSTKQTMHLRARTFRDSLGRTRVEGISLDGQNSGSTPEGILIVDPVAGCVYELWPAAHRFYRVAISQLQTDAANPANAAAADASQETTAGPPDIVDRYVASLRAPVVGTKETVVSEDLGTQVIAGQTVSGERKTRSAMMPASSAQTKQPVIDVREDWTSNDLGITMLSKHIDSNFGELDTQVVSVDRNEPDPSLFEVPSDYVSLQP